MATIGKDDITTNPGTVETLELLQGDDILRVAGVDVGDIFDGGPGRDLLDFRLSPVGYTGTDAIDLSGGSFTAHGATFIGFEVAGGSDLADEMIGSGAADLLVGQGGDDVILPGAGNDIVEGGDGYDTAIIEDIRAFFDVSVSDLGSIIVEDRFTGEFDVMGVERVQFSDGALLFGFDSQNLSFAYRIYAAAYGRTPDEGGLRFWTDVLDDRGDGPPDSADKAFLASFFLTADEFKDVYGENPTDEEYINGLYQNVLHRDADQSGYDFWLGVIASGQGRDDLLIWFTDSDENVANTEAYIDVGIWVA